MFRKVRRLYWGIVGVFRNLSADGKASKPFLSDISVTTFDLKSWSPDSIEDVYFGLDIEVGWRNEAGTNLFHAIVATPEALRAYAVNHPSRRILATRATIVVSEFSYDRLFQAISEIVDSAERGSYYESACVLNRYFHWEYEDYNPE